MSPNPPGKLVGQGDTEFAPGGRGSYHFALAAFGQNLLFSLQLLSDGFLQQWDIGASNHGHQLSTLEQRTHAPPRPPELVFTDLHCFQETASVQALCSGTCPRLRPPSTSLPSPPGLSFQNRELVKGERGNEAVSDEGRPSRGSSTQQVPAEHLLCQAPRQRQSI